MVIHQKRKRPEPWSAWRLKFSARWLVPLYGLDWLFGWIAHFLSKWVFLEVLEYLGTFSILIGVVFYFAESGDRLKQKHYQAWQVINTAQGKRGSGGRIEALQELNADRVPLVGIDLSDAFLQAVNLNKAQLVRSNFSSCDLRESSLQFADLAYASFDTANLRGGNLRYANLNHADLKEADLFGAELSDANSTGARFDMTDLRNANLSGLKWRGIASIHLANLFGSRNLPAGFAQWAAEHGAVFAESDDQWSAMQADTESSNNGTSRVRK